MNEIQDLSRLLAAALAGGVVGLEREWHDKPAGFRTNILICSGAAVFTMLSVRLAGESHDAGRVAAQVVTGVGFLGAGAILRHGGSVIGLTTAATIWSVASIGVAFGGGYYMLGAMATLMTTAVLLLLSPLEALIARGQRTRARYRIALTEHPEALQTVRRLLVDQGVPDHNWETREGPRKGRAVLVTVSGNATELRTLEQTLIQSEHVRALRRLNGA